MKNKNLNKTKPLVNENGFTELGYTVYIGKIMKALSGIDYLLIAPETKLTDEETKTFNAAAGFLGTRLETICKKLSKPFTIDATLVAHPKIGD